MRFDGTVGDLGSKGGNVVSYEMGYRGSDLEKLKAFTLEQARVKGLEVLGMREERDGDGWRVMMRVRGGVGIV